MKVTLRISSLFLGIMLWSVAAWAQPSNNSCSGATPVPVSTSEAAVVLVNGDTRNATPSGVADNSPSDYCFVDHADDDVCRESLHAAAPCLGNEGNEDHPEHVPFLLFRRSALLRSRIENTKRRYLGLDKASHIPMKTTAPFALPIQMRPSKLGPGHFAIGSPEDLH